MSSYAGLVNQVSASRIALHYERKAHKNTRHVYRKIFKNLKQQLEDKQVVIEELIERNVQFLSAFRKCPMFKNYQTTETETEQTTEDEDKTQTEDYTTEEYTEDDDDDEDEDDEDEEEEVVKVAQNDSEWRRGAACDYKKQQQQHGCKARNWW